MINTELMAEGKSLIALKRGRRRTYITKKIPKIEIENYMSNGWVVFKRNKKTVQMKQEKSLDIIFINTCWNLLANMGFTCINKVSPYEFIYDEEKISFDVFAYDDEVAICIKCMFSQNGRQKSSFKDCIENIGFNKSKVINLMRKGSGNKKVVFILAINGYQLSDTDKERLANFNILCFNEEKVEYFAELVKFLGESAKYQFLGNILEGQTIENLNYIVPAIEGKMGGNKYYSFSIEPEKLLKLGYVLHRNNGNKDDMPAYQRIIKKARLKSVSEFVGEGGFFPNSIIVNINSKGSPQFDLSEKQDKNSISKLGWLHLPKRYKSIYIIDGQHRLYGYSDSKYKSSNTVPVVAFVNLVKEDQIRLFMEINQNQKAVSKNLRTTLEADLLWTSEDKNEQRSALSARIAQDLGEDLNSPLYGNVIIGENKKTHRCCITLDMIKRAIVKSGMINRYRKNNEILEKGLLDDGNIDTSYVRLYKILSRYLVAVKNELTDEWKQGDQGYVCRNVGINSMIRIFADIMQHSEKSNSVNLIEKSEEECFGFLNEYIFELINGMKDITQERQKELRESYGAGGETKYWRSLQNILKEKYNDFNPYGLDEYNKSLLKEFNSSAEEMFDEIESYLKVNVKKILKETYGEDWLFKIPPNVYKEIKALAAEKEIEKQKSIDPWDCLFFIHYREIISSSENWIVFEKTYSNDFYGKAKEKKTQWLQRLNSTRKTLKHNNNIDEIEYKEVKDIYQWLKKSIIESST